MDNKSREELKKELEIAINQHPIAVDYFAHTSEKVTIIDGNHEPILFNVSMERAIKWLQEHLT